MLDQAANLRKMMNKGKIHNYEELKEDIKTKIITITSGKGGVGKSNFVVNLAISLTRQGKKVLIFDADIGMGNDDVLLGVYPKYSIFDVIKGQEIEDIVVEGPEGVMLLSGGSGLNYIEDLSKYERELFLTKLENLVGFDYILMDTGAGINKSLLAFIACSEELIILTTPEPTALTDAYSLLKATDHFKIKDKAKVVVNRVFNEEEGNITFNKFKMAVDRFLKVEVAYLGYILDDVKVVYSVKKQSPVVIAFPHSNASKCINNISKKVIGYMKDVKDVKDIDSTAKGLFKKIFNIFS